MNDRAPAGCADDASLTDGPFVAGAFRVTRSRRGAASVR